MKINNIYTSLGTELPEHTSLVISVSGCSAPCKGCFSTKLADFNYGDNWIGRWEEIKTKLKSGLYDSVVILGGEPFEQDKDDMFSLLILLEIYKLPICIYTRLELEEIPEELKFFLNYVTYLKTGKYDETKLNEKHYFASTNQKLLKKQWNTIIG